MGQVNSTESIYFFPFFDNEVELVESLAGYHTEVKCIVSLYEFLE